MSTRKQVVAHQETTTDINPDNKGRLFFAPGEIIPYRLVECGTEPLALMIRVDRVDRVSEFLAEAKPISEYAGFQMIPDGLIPLPPKEVKPRKTRKDAGTHKIPKSLQGHGVFADFPEIPDGEGTNLEQTSGQ